MLASSTFGVKYANGRDDLLSAKNEADGTIDFGKLRFTVASLDELAQNGIAEKTTIDGFRPGLCTTWCMRRPAD